MLAFLTICYCSIIWLIFFKLKLLPFNLVSKCIVAIVGIGGIIALLVFMSIYQPYSEDLLAYQPVARVGARVSGRVVEVAVKPDAQLKKGDVLFRIDDVPYQAEVERLKAALAEAEQYVPQLKATVDAADADISKSRSEKKQASREYERSRDLVKKGAGRDRDVDRWQTQMQTRDAAIRAAQAQKQQAKLAYESQIDGVNTTVAQLQASLKKAEWDLAETTIYAPADGVVTQIGLVPGSIVGQTAASHQMSFVYGSQRVYIATFTQNSKRHIHAGDAVEVAFDSLPGTIINGTVDSVVSAMGQGQLVPSGELITRNQNVPRGRVFVRLLIDDNEYENSEQLPIAGSGGAVAIYTDRMKPIRIIRKVLIRMYTWMNFLFSA
jgi:multidrug resistance efflux pump